MIGSLARLAAGRLTPSRILSEELLTRLARTLRLDGARVLITGAGRRSGSTEAALLGPADREHVLFVDLDPGRRPHVVADLTGSWPFREKSMDVVVSTWVIEHLAAPDRLFAEAFRVLRRGGVLVCAIPFIYRKHLSPRDYWRLTDEAITQLARSSGFGGMEISPIGGAPFLACVNLLWPLLGRPLLGLFAYLAAELLDGGLRVAAALLGRGEDLLTAYPMGYIAVLQKTPGTPDPSR